MRKIVPLNFNWRYSRVFKDEYIRKDYDDSHFKRVHIPHTNHEVPLNNFNEMDYQFVSCYRKRFHIEEKKEDYRYILNFDGVGHIAVIYVNEKEIGKHYGGYTAFQVDITDAVSAGNNIIVVQVDSRESNPIPPFGGTIDYLTFGGIYREVTLYVLNKSHIQDVFIKTLDVLEVPKVEIDLKVKLSKEMLIRVNVNAPDGRHVKTVEKSINTCESSILFPMGEVLLWDIDSPNLYEVIIELIDGNEVVDQVIEHIGFREARFTAKGFYLNGRKLKIHGINRHQLYPYVGYAMPKSVQEKDAEIIRNQLGFNLVRTSHYPQSKHFINACDRLGLLVFEEIPGWQYVGDESWQEVLLENLKEMIIRDRNHPSIILWGVRVNESGDNESLYRKTNQLAKELDGTRATGGVRCFKKSQLLEDVYTYNDFSLTTGDIVLQDVRDVIGEDREVPYLITEYLGHTFPTKRFDRETRRLEHALRHARVIDAYQGVEEISGAIAWSMNDYNTHKDFGSGDKICYHGILDMFRIPKLAAYTYMAEHGKTPFIEISTNFDIGEYDTSFIDSVYVFTNCDYVEVLRNGESIGKFYPDREEFPNMKHPPIRIPDLFGDVLVEKEGLSQEEAERIKRFVRSLARKGDLDKLTEKERAIISDPEEQKLAWHLYGKYVANWGGEKVSYTFNGYIDGKLVKTIVKGNVEEYDLKITPDETLLVIGDTYDATRVVVEEVGNNDNLIQYGFEPLQISVSDELELIGPSLISLISGKAAFWVKTRDKGGTGTVTVSSPKYAARSITINIVDSTKSTMVG
ncbi:MAG: glycoside hydrolase family 2 TIM barrel-domain containing protein [Bacillota bacterium]|nr:glycoside hydrolase family 2 TIM barrel-domain containing protein [Bacillota bacterium]